MDLHMPIQGGVAVMREITRDLPTCHVFVLTTLDDDESAFEAVRAGAQAYLLKDVDGAELLYTIRGLRCGESRLTPRIARKVVAEFRRLAAPDGSPTTYTAAPVLPPKEKQGPTGRKTFNEVEDKILQLISEGTSHPHIAAFLSIAEGTVRSFVTQKASIDNLFQRQAQSSANQETSPLVLACHLFRSFESPSSRSVT